ncbi:hypothetical protein BLOT_011204 [Blomia tropicalis]|nr:hypothetical protein BLOT_011204 [Blomia tropicalis]
MKEKVSNSVPLKLKIKCIKRVRYVQTAIVVPMPEAKPFYHYYYHQFKHHFRARKTMTRMKKEESTVSMLFGGNSYNHQQHILNHSITWSTNPPQFNYKFKDYLIYMHRTLRYFIHIIDFQQHHHQHVLGWLQWTSKASQHA